jgi:hypothetical protein
MVNLELTLMPHSTLVVTLEPSAISAGAPTFENTTTDAAISPLPASVEELRRVLREDIVGGLVVVIKGDFSTETLRVVASWFPRRLNGGRIAVVCESEPRGRAFASTLSVPLLPRPVRIFPAFGLTDALTWASQPIFSPQAVGPGPFAPTLSVASALQAAVAVRSPAAF